MAVDIEAPLPPISAWKWPDRASTRDRTRFTYEAPTDTLFVDCFGPARPAASIPLDRGDRDFVYVRVEVPSAPVVGYQIEDFLSHAVEVAPWMAEILAIADLRGVGPGDADDLRRRGIATGGQQPAAEHFLASLERLIA